MKLLVKTMNSNGRIPLVVILRRDELGLGLSTICGVKGVITLGYIP
ncbi:Uncharacterized protein APZ42_033911 [Daphnia magna]|uniref:Uncharacterized protein n=1 Tax=Daphnia magna TaxID=35525 RepID=A0A164KLN2_9CRUS|nr:Uncharacterized protein APZ42_033911 [Daphnia magna]